MPYSTSSTSNYRLYLSVFRRASDITPELGDLIEIDRTLYTHWGVYVGNGNVVHIVGEYDQDLPDDQHAYIRLASLESLAGDSYVRVNNKEVGAKERALCPIDPEQVVDKAMSMVGSKVQYNILTCNSEHYLTQWKYGQPWSDQASMTFTAIKTLRKESCSDAHNYIVSTLNEVLNSPGISSLSSSPSYSRSPSLSTACQTEAFHVK